MNNINPDDDQLLLISTPQQAADQCQLLMNNVTAYDDEEDQLIDNDHEAGAILSTRILYEVLQLHHINPIMSSHINEDDQLVDQVEAADDHHLLQTKTLIHLLLQEEEDHRSYKNKLPCNYRTSTNQDVEKMGKMIMMEMDERRRRRRRRSSYDQAGIRRLKVVIRERLSRTLSRIGCCGSSTASSSSTSMRSNMQQHKLLPEQPLELSQLLAHQLDHDHHHFEGANMVSPITRRRAASITSSIISLSDDDHHQEETMNLAAALAAERLIRSGSAATELEWSTSPRMSTLMALMMLEVDTTSSNGGGGGGGGDLSLWEQVVQVEDERLCCICMVRGGKGAACIPCGHTYCRICCREVWMRRGDCPLCNKPILNILHIY